MDHAALRPAFFCDASWLQRVRRRRLWASPSYGVGGKPSFVHSCETSSGVPKHKPEGGQILGPPSLCKSSQNAGPERAKFWPPQVSVNLAKTQDLRGANLGPQVYVNRALCPLGPEIQRMPGKCEAGNSTCCVSWRSITT